MFRAIRQLALLFALAASSLSCFGDGDGALPQAPSGFHLVYSATFHMGEPDIWDPPGGRRVELTRPLIMAHGELGLGEYLPLLNEAWRAGELSVEDGWIWDDLSGANLLHLDACDELRHDLPADSFALAPGASSFDPLRHVSWFGAALYCDWRNRAEDLPESYFRSAHDWECGPLGNPYDAVGWRLPTEAEWECAARAPDQRVYPWGDLSPDCSLANGLDEEGGSPCEAGPLPAGSHSPVGDSYYGFAHLAGNLREWCQDWYGEWENFEPLVDPWDIGVEIEHERSARGGSWWGPYGHLRAWNRDREIPEVADDRTGFRIVRRWP